jgi:tetratricopeptide (TPR) repeat protein
VGRRRRSGALLSRRVGIAAALALAATLGGGGGAAAAGGKKAVGKASAKGARKGAKSTSFSESAAPGPLEGKSIDDILALYTFVGDFSEHPPEREVSDEIFWRYPYVLPKATFPIEIDLEDPKTELPRSDGEGRAVDHMNRGRQLYLEGKYNEAKATWLTARARYGKTFPLHRRNDYFIGQSFAKLADVAWRAKGMDFADREVKSQFANAATFLSWAFIMKADEADPALDVITPKALYDLAAIYWRYERYAGAFGAATKGLDFLRKTGRKDYRPQLNRLSAEAFVRNRSYLEAIQQLDRAIRQDPDPKEAAKAFARAGDIYFDLNNYELAEDVYALGAKIEDDLGQINPAQLVLRGESLFWLGKFSEAQRMLHFAIDGGMYRSVTEPLDENMAAWADLRIADAFLARHENEKARLEYYRVAHKHGEHLAARIAKAREACLWLPEYGGNNVKHARELLETAKGQDPEMPEPAREISWACQVGSYTQRERTPEMLDRVRAFADAHPESRYLKGFREPVRSFQAEKIDALFAAGDVYRAVEFFERNRKTLFPKVPLALAERLFDAYADILRPRSAAEFWAAAARRPPTDLSRLRQAAVAAEMVAAGEKTPWPARDAGMQHALASTDWRVPPASLPVNYAHRILRTPSGKGHLAGMMALARAWGERDPAQACDFEYPVLSRAFEERPDLAARADQRLDAMITSLLPGLFKRDESCALSLLELEAARLKSQPARLAERYLARQSWPLTGAYLHLYWTMAEHVYDRGAAAEARKLWGVLQERGPAGSPEVQFANARLDPTKTELEKMW